MYLPMKSVSSSKGELARKIGMWLGIIEKTKEVIIGTKDGVVKCRTVSRLPDGNQWNLDLVMNVKGWPWEPILGKRGMHIPVDVDDIGEDPEGDCGMELKPIEALNDEVPVELRGSVAKLHISRKATAKYGLTTGCQGCNDIARRGQRAGKIIYKHSDECRKRVVQEMQADPEYRKLMEKHGYALEICNMEIFSVAIVQEKEHQVQKAITEIERKERQRERGAKQGQLDKTMRSILFEQMDVVEAYSPPRIAAMAQKMGVRSGWSFGFTTCDKHGRPWDFNYKQMRNDAVRLLLEDKPRLLIGSPMCGPFSTMNQINYVRMTEEEKQQKFEYGRRHLELCVKLYEVQWREGRYLLNEHPDGAKSWQEDCVRPFLNRQGVARVVGDQCRYGFRSCDGQRDGFARKRTGFMRNAPCIAKMLNLRCPNTNGYRPHDHVTLDNGRVAAAQVYPPTLCKVVSKGLMEQIEADRKGQFIIAEINADGKSNGKDLKVESNKLQEQYKTVDEEDNEALGMAWDDVFGAELDPAAVKKARAEEIDYVHKMFFLHKRPC